MSQEEGVGLFARLLIPFEKTEDPRRVTVGPDPVTGGEGRVGTLFPDFGL